MKNKYSFLTKHRWLALLLLISNQIAWGQPIPDIQWNQNGSTFAVTTDGNIATTRQITVPTSFAGLSLTGDQLVRIGLDGSLLGQTGLLVGGPIGSTSLPLSGQDFIRKADRIAAGSDGGILAIGVLGVDPVGTAVVKLRNGGFTYWTKLNNLDRTNTTIDDLIGTPDGGFLVLQTTTPSNAPSSVIVRKHDAGGNFSWSKSVAYPTPNPASPDLSLTKGKAVINTADGGYLVAGYYNKSGSINDLANSTGWVAKLDGQGNVGWQKLLDELPVASNSNGPVPGTIVKLNAVTDVIISAFDGGYALVGAGQVPSAFISSPLTTALLELDGNGNFKRAKAIDATFTEAYLTVYLGDSGNTKYYAVGNTSVVNGSRPQILKISTAVGSLSDPALFSIVSQRTFDGLADGALKGIDRAGDGSLAFFTNANQVVKLNVEATASSLVFGTPTYNCQTGAITFTVTGGNGSPITYTAPGISRASATDNFGTVEPGLRNDPKVIQIMATQNGASVTYNFDLKAACSNTSTPQPPVLNRPIPDQFLTVGQSLSGNGFIVGSYFTDPTVNVPGYVPNWSFTVSGLPDGLYTFYRPTDLMFLPAITILGTPTTAGIYTVTVTARTAAFSSSPVTTTFKITVSTTQQPGGSLALSQPTYNCQTGAITFNVTGGDGSPITYIAPGISRSSATSNSGTVEQGLRNDPKPITIQAIQNGQTATVTFDFSVYCNNPKPPNPPVSGALTLLAPAYSCATGAIHFNTSGGNGSLIEFQAAGITGWTSNPDQFVDKDSRTASDVKPFTLMARQNGQIVTYIWDLKAACGRARIGVPETVAGLQVRVLGNPVEGQSAEIEISGAVGQTVKLELVNLQGSRLYEQQINPVGSTERVSIPVGASKGLLLLKLSTETERQQVKLIKL